MAAGGKGVPKYDRERAARVLVDAIVLGDKTAAQQWKITVRTVVRYRARMDSDPELAKLVREKGQKADEHWAHARLLCLRKALEKATELLAKADDPKYLPAIAELIDKVGQLDIAALVLNGSGSTHRQGAGFAAPPANAGAGADRAPTTIN